MKYDNKSMYPLAMKAIGYPANTDPASLPSGYRNDQFQRFLDQMTTMKKTGKPGAWCNRVICQCCRYESSWQGFGAACENGVKAVCGNCGETGKFIDSVERWWSLSVWWRPSTWNAGYWEVKK